MTMDRCSPPWPNPLPMWVVPSMVLTMLPLHVGHPTPTRFQVDLQDCISLTVQLQQPVTRLRVPTVARPLARSVKYWRDLFTTVQPGRKSCHPHALGAVTGAARQITVTVHCCLLLSPMRASPYTTPPLARWRSAPLPCPRRLPSQLALRVH